MFATLRKLFVKCGNSDDIARYYDNHTSDYIAVGGDVIQAYRPTRTDELLGYLVASIGLMDGMRVLDAGCGVGGPAIDFAKRLNISIDGITISEVQAKLACEKIASQGLSDRIKIRVGDYAKLGSIYKMQSFDAVIFLESLGHSADPVKPIRSAFEVLKPGGFIYIKDYFQRLSYRLQEQLDIDEVVGNINANYCYNTLDLNEVITALRSTGFEIQVIKKPELLSDFSYTQSFEDRVKIKTFTKHLPAVDWLEIKCTRS
ncbi:MAG TPA: class I SAM-dependent methyltransferase [Planktothrix sp.]|jgi:ubiquinone/menaquinone biosynthesis C-methylase UbiE